MARKTWVEAAVLLKSWRYRAMPDRLAILNAIWEKEMGHLSRHWKLKGVRKETLYVVPRSPAAALELQLRAAGVMRNLNKYFKTAWIKQIKATS